MPGAPNSPGVTAPPLRTRAALEQEGPRSENAFNEPVPGAWNLVGNIWCAVLPATGREYWLAHQLLPETTHQVWIRYRTGLLQGQMRFNIGGRLFYIQQLLKVPAERARYLLCLCKETGTAP